MKLKIMRLCIIPLSICILSGFIHVEKEHIKTDAYLDSYECYSFDNNWVKISGSLDYGTNTLITNDTSAYHRGNSCLHYVKHSMNNTNAVYNNSLSLQFESGDYWVSYWVKSKNCTPGSTINLYLYNCSVASERFETKTFTLNNSLSQYTNWTKVSNKITLSSDISYYPYFEFSQGKGDIYIDDISIKKINDDNVYAKTHSLLDSDGNYNDFYKVIENDEVLYQHKISELSQYDKYQLDVYSSASYARLDFYDFGGNIIPDASVVKTSTNNTMYFTAPSCYYATITIKGAPTGDLSIKKIGSLNIFYAELMGIQTGFAVREDKYDGKRDLYYVSKENCINPPQNWPNFYYETFTGRERYSETAVKPYCNVTFTYSFKIDNASSDFRMVNRLGLWLSTSSSTESYINPFIDTIDGGSATQITSSYDDGNWHTVSSTFNNNSNNTYYFYFYWTVNNGSADIHVNNIKIHYSKINVTFDNDVTKPILNKEDGYSFTPLDKPTKSKIEDSILYLNGEKKAPIIYLEPNDYSTMYELSEEYYPGYHLNDCNYRSGAANLELYSTYYGDIGTMWKSDGSIRYDEFDASIYSFLDNSSKARVLVSFAMFAPIWWLNNHSESKIISYDTTGVHTLDNVSFSSTSFISEASDILSQIINHMKAQPYWNSIFGFKINGGRTYEWMQEGQGDGDKDLADYSEAGINGFRNYLRNKYSNNINLLNSSWGTSLSSFDSINPPTYLERTTYSSALLHDNKFVDYNLFINYASSEMLLTFANIVKSNTNHDYIVGAYNGYLWYSGSSTGLGTAHTSFERLLKSDDIDFISSPVGYGERTLGQYTSMMSLNDSIRAYGKLYILEQDNRTQEATDYLYGNDKDLSSLYTALGCSSTNMDSIDFLKQDFAYDFVNGSGMWYYDMTGNWFDNDQYYQLFNKEKDEMDYSMKFDIDYTNDVAVFVDDENFAYFSSNSNEGSENILLNAYTKTRKQLQAIGTPYDVYSMSTLVDGKVPKHKVNILLSTITLNNEERNAINTYLKNDGQYIIFEGPCGYQKSATDYNKSYISDLTGMTINTSSSSSYMKLQVAVTNSNIDNYGSNNLMYGAYSNNFDFISYVSSGYTESWGNINSKSIVGLAYKNCGSYHTIYSSVGNIPAEVYRYVLSRANVHTYSNDYSDVISANSNYVSLTSGAQGNKTISLPANDNYSVYDVFKGKYLNLSCSSFSTYLNCNETKLFRIDKPVVYEEGKYKFIDEVLNKYESKMSLSYKYTNTNDVYTDVEFRLKFASTSGIVSYAQNFNDGYYGLEISDGFSTKTYDSKNNPSKLHIDEDNGVVYTTISLGDCLNNLDRVSYYFTVKGFVSSYDGSNKYYTSSKTYSIKDMVNEYYNNLGISEVKGLLDIFIKKGLYSHTITFENGFFDQEMDDLWSF